MSTIPPAHHRKRMLALKKANEIRTARAQLHRRVLRREITIDAVLSRPPRCVRSMMILDLLAWMPRYGDARSMVLLNRARVPGTREVGELTAPERRRIRRMVAS